MFGNVRLAFGTILENLRKSSENHQKRPHQYIYIIKYLILHVRCPLLLQFSCFRLLPCKLSVFLSISNKFLASKLKQTLFVYTEYKIKLSWLRMDCSSGSSIYDRQCRCIISYLRGRTETYGWEDCINVILDLKLSSSSYLPSLLIVTVAISGA